MSFCAEPTAEELRIRIHGDASLPTLIYLPGLHGDWTLVTSFRLALAERVRFVEFTYPRTLAWSLDDYAAAIGWALLAHDITHGWLLGESFGSQIVWPLARRGRTTAAEFHFVTDGVILAGGFGRHPLNWGVRLAGKIADGLPLRWLTRLLFGYAHYARFRHRRAPETLAGIQEFLVRRTELDRQAAKHRLDLMAVNDPRLLAGEITRPVYHLTGLFDPVVPWPPAQRWLKHHCPGYRGRKIIATADHNVLGTAPKAAAEQVLEWMNGE